MLVGIGFFFLLDGFIQTLGHGHGHGHSHGKKGKQASPSPTTKKGAALAKKKKDDDYVEETAEEEEATGSHNSHVWLHLLADAAHNVTDGFVIGASFLASVTGGYRTTLLVLVHEIPHELGDFAVLKASGWGLVDIVEVQFLTALGNLLGCLAVLFVGTHVEAAKGIIGPVAGGSFIYVALVSILSELNDHKGSAEERGFLRRRIMQTIAFALGVASLYSVTLLEAYLGVHAH